MTKETLYHDYILIKSMHSPMWAKKRILTELLASYHDSWSVIGITTAALDRFSEFQFKKEKGIHINRAHIVPRSETYERMLTTDFTDIDFWWTYHLDNDKTVLATSTENRSNVFSEITFFDEPVSLFRKQGFMWMHQKAEIEFLKELHTARCRAT